MEKRLADEGKTIFQDRRGGNDRRTQNLPMPAGLDRRHSGCARRSGRFNAQPWWLRIDYAVEFVSEKDLPEREREQSKPKKKSLNSNHTGNHSTIK